MTKESDDEWVTKKEIIAVLLRPTNVLDPNALVENFNYDGTRDYEDAFVDFLVEVGYKKLDFFEA